MPPDPGSGSGGRSRDWAVAAGMISPATSSDATWTSVRSQLMASFTQLPDHVLGWAPEDVVRWVGGLNLHG